MMFTHPRGIAAALLCGALLSPLSLAQSTPLAKFSFEGDSISSSQTPDAAISDLVISNNFMFGNGGSDRWLCLTTDWNDVGGNVSFTVTPNGGVALDLGLLTWRAVTNNPSRSDSVQSADVLVDGVLAGSIAALQHDVTESVDLSVLAEAQGITGPVTIEIRFQGNPTGQSAYEIGDICLEGGPCVATFKSVQPGNLPVITSDCFALEVDCLGTVQGVTFGTTTLPMAPVPFGGGSWEQTGPGMIEVCPPQCLPANTYTITVDTTNGQVQTTVTLAEPADPTLACADVYRVGEMACIYMHPGTNNMSPAGPGAFFSFASFSNLPTVVPGLVTLGLGNNGMEFLQCDLLTAGGCVEQCLGVPGALAAGWTVYIQAVVIPFGAPIQNLPTTPVCAPLVQ